jgi:glycosyltransferase involved in cell wall biosynthesis
MGWPGSNRREHGAGTDGRPQRALFIVHGLNVGGIETYILRVLRGSDRKKLQIDICVTGPEIGVLGSDVEAAGSAILRCPYTHAALPYIKRLVGILRRGGYDTVCDFGGDFAAATLVAARIAGVDRRIALYRSTSFGFKPTLARKVVARFLRLQVCCHATKVIGNSQAVLRAHFPEALLRFSRFGVLRNGIDLQRFTRDARVRAAVRERLGIPPQAVVFGHVGSFTPPKAQEVAIAAFSKLLKASPGEVAPEVRLVLVGDGSRKPLLEEQARAQCPGGGVIFAGLQRDVPAWLSAMDVFVFPSRYEGCPNALLEAQAVGLPAIASNRPEMQEATPPSNHEHLVGVGDVEAMAAKMTRFLVDPGLRASAGQAAEAFVREHFDLRDSVTRFVDLIGEAT